MSVLARVTDPYGAMEAWAYDRFIAPAVFGLRAGVEGDLLARLRPGGRLLEVGCGGGQLAAHLASVRPDVEVTGLDLSPGQVRRARRRAPEARFVTGTALDLPFVDGEFDAVVSVASIKHWPDPARGLRECVRVLAPGGGLAVVEADRGCRLEDCEAFVRGWRIPTPLRRPALLWFRAHVAGVAFDLDDARALLAPLGLTGAEVRRIPGTPGLLMAGFNP